MSCTILGLQRAIDGEEQCECGHDLYEHRFRRAVLDGGRREWHLESCDACTRADKLPLVRREYRQAAWLEAFW